MAKLSKQQTSMHARACALLEKDVLTLDERYFVLENWQESATHLNGAAGAYFTPVELARGFAIEVWGHSIIDLCAGIGSLAFAAYHHLGAMNRENAPAITCVELNPDYVAVGRKILPEATWLVADVLNLPKHLAGFDCAIANPPFGRIGSTGHSPRYTGSEFEFKVIDIASDLASGGVFLIPQSSSPFRLSGQRSFNEQSPEKYLRFSVQTSIELSPNCGIDTLATPWHCGLSVTTEIALADFKKARAQRKPLTHPSVQRDLFAAA